MGEIDIGTLMDWHRCQAHNPRPRANEECLMDRLRRYGGGAEDEWVGTRSARRMWVSESEGVKARGPMVWVGVGQEDCNGQRLIFRLDLNAAKQVRLLVRIPTESG